VLPIASADAAGLVIYIGTLSKVLAPGLRLGFIVAPGDLIERLVAYRSFADLQGDPHSNLRSPSYSRMGLFSVTSGRCGESIAHAWRRWPRHSGQSCATFDVPGTSGGTAIWVRTRDAQ
jgi:DNA-binding transcriptional MocR family regulator